MDAKIKTAVSSYSNLTLQVNDGEIHRIMRADIRRGSLWFEPRKQGYTVCLTGEVEGLLYNFVRENFGTPYRVHQGKNYWLVSGINEVEQIIERFSQRLT